MMGHGYDMLFGPGTMEDQINLCGFFTLGLRRAATNINGQTTQEYTEEECIVSDDSGQKSSIYSIFSPKSDLSLPLVASSGGVSNMRPRDHLWLAG